MNAPLATPCAGTLLLPGFETIPAGSAARGQAGSGVCLEAPPTGALTGNAPGEQRQPFAFDPLTPFCADLIVCDPPWSYQLRSKKGEAKSAQAHYACLDADAIRALPVLELGGRDCWLVLWATAPLLDVGVACLKGWGFRYLTFAVWRKVTINGRRAVGTGYVVRSEAEIVLVGAIGAPMRARPLDGLFEGVRREHSRKPDALYAQLERFAPHARKVDLFGRQSRPGWAVWGDEAQKFDGERAA